MKTVVSEVELMANRLRRLFGSTKMTVLNRALALFFVSSVLTACAGLTGSNKALDTYDLGGPTIERSQKRVSGKQILIVEPQALKILDSENIVVRNGGASIAYLNGAQWSDRLPKMVQARLVQAFENSGRFGGVGRPGEGLAIDYQVITDIRAFEVGGSRAEVEISVKLLNDRIGDVVSSKVFSQSVNAAQGNAGYIQALDVAFNKVALEIVDWVASKS